MIDYHITITSFQDPTISGKSVTPASHIHASTMLSLISMWGGRIVVASNGTMLKSDSVNIGHVVHKLIVNILTPPSVIS
jgi:hypothetical protein